ncbi:MAG: prepilin-type N-terminal cleavage/methylation domain-containing protein [Clostridia bacterium]|nr:prepilin-type N-terminal cleavage/methylation domain-containing protein [Clostridia bacterium]
MFRKQKGITLIALVITIIVLLILAGVSINLVVGEGGILGKAQNAVSASRAGSAKEEIGLAWSACETEYMEEWVTNQGIDKSTFFTAEKLNANLGGKGIVKDVDYKGTEGSTLTYASVDGNLVYKMKISSGGQVSIVGEPTVSETPVTPGASTYTAYSVGDEVELKSDRNEHFYVIKASGEDEEKVTLLAKKNIDTTSLAQSDSAGTIAFCSNSTFSSLGNDFRSVESLNDDGTIIADTTSAVYYARKYAERITGNEEDGRLMLWTEALPLEASYASIIYGSTVGYLSYWLGSSDSPTDVDYICGEDSDFGYTRFEFDDYAGVRPVIEISKSLIK